MHSDKPVLSKIFCRTRAARKVEWPVGVKHVPQLPRNPSFFQFGSKQGRGAHLGIRGRACPQRHSSLLTSNPPMLPPIW